MSERRIGINPLLVDFLASKEREINLARRPNFIRFGTPVGTLFDLEKLTTGDAWAYGIQAFKLYTKDPKRLTVDLIQEPVGVMRKPIVVSFVGSCYVHYQPKNDNKRHISPSGRLTFTIVSYTAEAKNRLPIAFVNFAS